MAYKKEIIKLYKREGETPLECLNRFRRRNSKYEKIPMTYAGRLDPLAEGLLVVMAGKIDENEKKKILDLPKIYEFDILWGFETDSYDVLGMPKLGAKLSQELSKKENTELRKMTKKYIGSFKQKYPPFSSRPIGGIPLFTYAKEGTVDINQIPSKVVEIYSLDILGQKEMLGKRLKKEILSRIKLVKGDFRQRKISEAWKRILSGKEKENFFVTSFHSKVSSGTYIRSIAHSIGKEFGRGGLAFHIKRTQVGELILP